MKLPLDNFQILGVSPTSNTRHVLIMLERRLERSNYSGFTEDTIRKRYILLKEYSKPLLDVDKRKELEQIFRSTALYSDDTRFLIAGDGYETAALLLLLEANQPDDCLDLAGDYLDSLKKHDKDSEETLDLYRIIAYASINWARELKSKRFYEEAARVMIHGLERLSRNSKVDDLKQSLQFELEAITPFRILDLLSRNTNERQRDRGIKLLIDLVQERGGLENRCSLYMEHLEFQAFFRQIRSFLTLQEQIDLYQRWTANGSETALFLLGISMVACGFARRKPERLVAALKIMERLQCKDLTDIKSYISLLLGEVSFSKTSEDEQEPSIINPMQVSHEITLATLCINCRNWLELDVLDGYRDLEAKADLEAYFSDSDVTRFIEENDKKSGSIEYSTVNGIDSINIDKILFDKGQCIKELDRQDQDKKTKHTRNTNQLLLRVGLLRKVYKFKWVTILMAMTLIPAILVSLFRSGTMDRKYQMNTKNSAFAFRNEGNLVTKKNSSLAKDVVNKPETKSVKTVPFERELSKVISDWLVIKSETLASGIIPANAYKIATKESLERLRQERREDEVKGQKQLISARLLSLKILGQQRDVVEVLTTISYNDQRLNQDNVIIDRTPQHTFTRKYILVKKGPHWQLQ